MDVKVQNYFFINFLSMRFEKKLTENAPVGNVRAFSLYPKLHPYINRIGSQFIQAFQRFYADIILLGNTP